MASERFVGFGPALEKGRQFERAERPTALYESSTRVSSITAPARESGAALYAPHRSGRSGSAESYPLKDRVVGAGMNGLRNALNFSFWSAIRAMSFCEKTFDSTIKYLQGRHFLLFKLIALVWGLVLCGGAIFFGGAITAFSLLAWPLPLLVGLVTAGIRLFRKKPVELPRFMRIMKLNEYGEWEPN